MICQASSSRASEAWLAVFTSLPRLNTPATRLNGARLSIFHPSSLSPTTGSARLGPTTVTPNACDIPANAV